MQDKMAGRRVAPRYPIIRKAKVIELEGGAVQIARTSDISRTGCYVATRQTLTSGSAIRIKLTDGSESFEVQGTVKYVSPGLGMGVLFEQQIPAKQLTILSSWLEGPAKQPA